MPDVTVSFLNSGKSRNGSWNANQLRALGLDGFEHKWMRRVIGTIITQKAADEFLRLKDTHLDKTNENGTKIEPVHIPWKDQYKHPLWQKKRLQIMQRDGFHCMICGNSERQLHIHHNRYDHKLIWKCRSDSMITVCSECHEKFHNRRFT